jgi:O-antigen biosynthesis protein
MKMKIGYIIPNCSVSGGMAVICQHGNRLLDRGHSVVFLSTATVKPMDWFPNQRVPIHNAMRWNDNLDVVVATAWNTTFLLQKIQAKVKCYFVQSDETRFHPNNSRWQHLATLSYYFGVNYFTEARWLQKWLKVNFQHDSELVPNGLDRDIFHPSIPLEPKGKKPRILLEGAISLPYKGMKEAFEAVHNIDAEIWCVSSYGAPQPDWKCDRFFEHTPMYEMRKIYSSCDILLKLSRVEGFFGPPLEMMACGGAVVVGRVTGYDEYIVDGHNALVVDPLDIEAAERAVQQLIADPALRKRLIQAGAQTAREWDWGKSVDTLESYYARLITELERCHDLTQRSKYDNSIIYVYDIISRGFYPDEVTSVHSADVVLHNALEPARTNVLKRLTRRLLRVKYLFNRERAVLASSDLFDHDWYLRTNGDVANADMDPVEHYINYGAEEGRDPGPLFSTRNYLAANPDVKAARVNPLLHYLRFGRKERRRTHLTSG